MRKAFFLGPVLFIAILAGSLYYLIPLPLDYTTIEGQINRELSSLLKEDRLSFQKIEKGMKVPLHSLIATFPSDPDSEPNPKKVFATIAIPRSKFDKEYLSYLFSDMNAYTYDSHNLAHPGIETILQNDRVTVTVHDGVMLHLQNKVPGKQNIQIFSSENLEGTVTEVQGTVYLSKDRATLSKRLENQWAFFSKSAFQGNKISDKRCLNAQEEITCRFVPRIPIYPPRRKAPLLKPTPILPDPWSIEIDSQARL